MCHRCIRAGVRINAEQAGAFVSTMSTKLYTLENLAPGNIFELVGGNLILMLGLQARAFHHVAGISDQVLNAFQQRLAHPPSKVDNLILEELARLMLVDKVSAKGSEGKQGCLECKRLSRKSKATVLAYEIPIKIT